MQLNEKEKYYIPYETATCVALPTANKTLLCYVLILHLNGNISERLILLYATYRLLLVQNLIIALHYFNHIQNLI